MPNRPEPSEPTKLFCAKVNVNRSPGGSVIFDLVPADINDIPQDAKDHISTTFGQNVLTALLSSYPQYPQGSDTLDIKINAPTFIVYMKGPGNWFFREDTGQPPMRLKPGQNPGLEFGPVVNFGGTGSKITAHNCRRAEFGALSRRNIALRRCVNNELKSTLNL